MLALLSGTRVILHPEVSWSCCNILRLNTQFKHRYQNEDITSWKTFLSQIQNNGISTGLLTLHQSLFVVIVQHLISLPASFHTRLDMPTDPAWYNAINSACLHTFLSCKTLSGASLDRRLLCWLVWECVDNKTISARTVRLDAGCVVTVSPQPNTLQH